ncbi:MAG: hypothetical protein AMXMBFR58_16810 [Phycisphaerae bacterium]|nr:hypothetical protein [Phycisphaerales bacterium]
MKLRITIENKSYEVDVEVIDPVNITSAASRVEGLPLKAPLPPIKHTNGLGSARTPSKARKQEATEEKAERKPIQPWHDLTVGKPGECVSPVPGTVVEVCTKVGDAVKPGDPLVRIEISNVVSPSDTPAVGTVRSLEAGVVKEIAVHKGEAIRFGQVLVRVQLAQTSQ